MGGPARVDDAGCAGGQDCSLPASLPSLREGGADPCGVAFLVRVHDEALRVRAGFDSAPEASISWAWARLVDESFSPPSMRAISATRASLATGATALVVVPARARLLTTK